MHEVRETELRRVRTVSLEQARESGSRQNVPPAHRHRWHDERWCHHEYVHHHHRPLHVDDGPETSIDSGRFTTETRRGELRLNLYNTTQYTPRSITEDTGRCVKARYIEQIVETVQ